MRRDETDYLSGGDPHEIWYRRGGKQVGYVTNNGMDAGSYGSSIATRQQSTANGPFRNGATYGSNSFDFDQSVSGINTYSQGGAGGSYAVRAGDTLSGIAAQLWGDGSLWYRLAEANGLGMGSALVEGQRLTIPPGVMKNTHNASTFTPYDPSEVLGDLSTTAPVATSSAAKRNRCGAFGAILLMAVAVASSIARAAKASGKHVISTGLREKFIQDQTATLQE